MIKHLVTFGIEKNTGNLRNINDVSSGLACNCVCPCCGSELEAHKGSVKKHHFQHHSSAECKGAFESQIHLLSKEIIEKNKQLMLPKYEGKYSYIPERRQLFSEVIIELSQEDLRPDCLCKYWDEQGNEQVLLVEILYSHAVDENKMNKIRERHLSCVEIDVSHLFNDTETIDEEDLTEFLLNSTDNRKWVNNPLGDERILCEADRIRKNSSLFGFLVEYEGKTKLEFCQILYCLFSTGYRLSSEDKKSFYDTIKLHRSDYFGLNPEGLRRYVGIVQMMLCHLLKSMGFEVRIPIDQYLEFVCFELNESHQQFIEWIDFVIRHPQQVSQRQNSLGRSGGQIYQSRGNRYIRRWRL